MTLKFPNPFQGSPSRIDLSGLFLFSPTIFLEIEGGSISKIFKDLGKESLLKRVETAKKRNVSKKRIDSIIDEFKNSEVFPENFKEVFTELVNIGIKEDEAGGFVPESVGPYATLVKIINGSDEQENISQRFIIEVESKSRKAIEFALKEQYSDAGKAILAEEFFAPFLWDGMRDALNKVETSEGFLMLRISIAAEIFLATMIIRESYYESKTDGIDTKSFLDIWPLNDKKAKNPFGRLFEWVKQEANVKTASEFFKSPALIEVEMDMLRLKRWSNGSHQPRREWLEDIAKHLWHDPHHAPFAVRVGLAQYSNFLGHTAQNLISKIPADLPIEVKKAIYPWPNYPHDNTDFASWGRMRYQFWRDYARDYQAKTL